MRGFRTKRFLKNTVLSMGAVAALSCHLAQPVHSAPWESDTLDISAYLAASNTNQITIQSHLALNSIDNTQASSIPVPSHKPLCDVAKIQDKEETQKVASSSTSSSWMTILDNIPNDFYDPIENNARNVTDGAPIPQSKPAYFGNLAKTRPVQDFYQEAVAPAAAPVLHKEIKEHSIRQMMAFAWGFSTNREITKKGDPEAHDPNRITDELIPWASIEKLDIPERPSPIFELGEPYMDIGPLDEGFEIFTGARWRPGFMIFGQVRSALQSFENLAGVRTNEWANRLDLFANLRLTGTERVFASFRPLDQDGEFTGYNFDQGSGESRFNADLLTFFVEGDFDQLFPNWLNPTGMEPYDYGFAVGKQPVFIQEGFLINDVLESIALANHNIHVPGIANAHSTFLYAWDDVNRNDNQETDAQLWGLFSEVDLRKNRVQMDVAYVNADDEDGGDGFYTGLSSFQRVGEVWTTVRINNSIALDNENAQISDGTLLFTEVSWEPDGTNDIAYFNSFWAIDNFSVAANDVAGPLGDVGILFAAKNIGAFGAPVANNANDSYGFALGYQHMFNNFRSQIIGEIAYRADNEPEHKHTTAAGLSYEQAIGQHMQLFVDTFAARDSDQDDLATGLRTELSIKF